MVLALEIGAPTLGVAAGDAVAVVEEPRAFGHTVGDLLVQRVRLGADGPAGAANEWVLPSGGRVDVWLERRPARIETAADGSRWLVLAYQVTNAPVAVTQAELPALVLRTRAGDVLRVPAWPISVGPLAPDAAFGAGGFAAMQPDRTPAPLALAPIERRIGLGLAGLVATLIAWLAWWIARNRRDAARLPFARAWREFRRQGMTNGEAGGCDDRDAAWRIVHRALNETAGFVVQSSSLPRLLTRAPWLEPLRAQLEQFYLRSEARFFSLSGDEPLDRHAVHTPTPALVALTRSLYRAEKDRHR
jgi:mxaA protein